MAEGLHLLPFGLGRGGIMTTTRPEDLPERLRVWEAGGQVAVQSEPGLLDVPGVTAAAGASFFDAAALFYEQAPWTKSGERPIRVECAKFTSGPWYAVVTGQAGLATGLILYDNLETLQ